MFKKTLISLAVASSLGLTGCFDSGSDTKNANPSPNYQDDSINGTWLIFNPATQKIPTPTDLSFAGTQDGTFKIDLNPESPPPAVALDSLSGASTVDPIVLKTNGQLPSTGDMEADLEAANLIPNQTVFLIPLKYASGDPIQGLGNQEPPTVDQSKISIGEAGIIPNFKVDIVELDGNSAIRIVPTEPLSPNTRYVVGVTKAVKDASGQPLIQDPVYNNITSEDAPIISSRLDGARALMNRIWEPTIISFAELATGGALKLEQDDIALSYSLTTSNDVKVLSYIANPELWLRDQLENFVKVSAAKQVKAPATYDDVKAAVDAAVAAFKPSEVFKNDLLQPCDDLEAQAKFSCVAPGVAAFIDSQLPADMEIAEPDVRDVEPGPSSVPAQQKSAVLTSIPGSDFVSVNEGNIKLPYHLGQPTTQDGSAIQAKSWTADQAFATELNKIFTRIGLDLELPQGTGVSEVVNSIFPFPASTGDIEVPMLIIHPTSVDVNSASDTFTDVVIFQHGITTDRSAALAFGSALVAAGLNPDLPGGPRRIAVVAIDQPLHGVAPSTREDRIELSETLLEAAVLGVLVAPDEEPTAQEQATAEAFSENFAPALATNLATFEAALAAVPDDSPVKPLAEGFLANPSRTVLASTVANAGSTIPGLTPVSTISGVNAEGINERHFGWGSNPDYDRTLDVGPGNLPWAKMDFDLKVNPEEPGASGDLFINLGNFLNSRDNLRQGALDLLNLRASLPVEVPAFADATFHFVGHSLGTVNGNAFVMAANASGKDELAIANSHLMTPASGIVRMLENSPSFAPTILAGLNQQAGLTQQDGDLQSFFGVFQAAVDTVDPINYAAEMQGSRTLISQVDGDRTTINAAYDFYIDGSNTQWPEGYSPLQVGIGNLMINSPEAPLAGSEPLAAWSATAAFSPDPAANNYAEGLPGFTRYPAGTHGTPVLPREEKAEAPNLAEFEFEFLKNRTIAQGGEVIVDSTAAAGVFKSLVGQTLYMILNSPSSAPE
jgi:hypothetical protein